MTSDAYARYDLTSVRSVDKDIRHYMADEIDEKDRRIAELEAERDQIREAGNVLARHHRRLLTESLKVVRRFRNGESCCDGEHVHDDDCLRSFAEVYDDLTAQRLWREGGGQR